MTCVSACRTKPWSLLGRATHVPWTAVSVSEPCCGTSTSASIESLEGIVPYAASRLLLLSFDTHCIPVDDQLRIQLIEAEVSDAAVEVPELSNWLATQVKAGEGVSTHFALQSWVDEIAGKAGGADKKKTPRKVGAKG
jgi:hypothetical protein